MPNLPIKLHQNLLSGKLVKGEIKRNMDREKDIQGDSYIPQALFEVVLNCHKLSHIFRVTYSDGLLYLQ